MINLWYSHDGAYHEFSSVSEVGDWIGGAANPSTITCQQPDRIIQLTIGGPTRKESTFNEFTETTETSITDRTTGIRIFLARLAELYDS